jgi:hypothetical protein
MTAIQKKEEKEAEGMIAVILTFLRADHQVISPLSPSKINPLKAW